MGQKNAYSRYGHQIAINPHVFRDHVNDNFRLPRPFFDGSDDAGTSGTSGTGDDAGPISNWRIEERHRSGLLSLIAENDGLEGGIQQLWTENANERQKARIARDDANRALADVARLTAEIERGAPADSVVLNAEEAALWQQYRSFGSPDDITTQIDAGNQAGAQLATYQRNDLIRQSAQLNGFNPEILIDLDRATPGLKWEIRNDDGTPSAYVIDGDGDAVSVHDYAAARWGAYMPVLQAGKGAQLYPQQRPTPLDSSNGSSVVSRFIAATNDERPSRLAVATGQTQHKDK